MAGSLAVLENKDERDMQERKRSRIEAPTPPSAVTVSIHKTTATGDEDGDARPVSLASTDDEDTKFACPIILANTFPELTPSYPTCPLVSSSPSNPVSMMLHSLSKSASIKFKLYSTEEMFMIPRRELPPPSALFFGPFASLRETLDYSYHQVYQKERQAFQDKILQNALHNVEIVDWQNGETCSSPTQPYIVFTAGAMGAGKSHTIQALQRKRLFPLSAFVTVDPDNLRTQLPEFHSYYNRINPLQAGEMTRKEAGHLVELLTLASLQYGRNVLVDGTLQDYVWYKQYFQHLRKSYPNIQIAILHVVAPTAAIYQRVKRRGMITGRFVPKEKLEQTLKQVPLAMEHLKHEADFFCTLYNPSGGDEELEIMTEGICWETFGNLWNQS